MPSPLSTIKYCSKQTGAEQAQTFPQAGEKRHERWQDPAKSGPPLLVSYGGASGKTAFILNKWAF